MPRFPRRSVPSCSDPFLSARDAAWRRRAVFRSFGVRRTLIARTRPAVPVLVRAVGSARNSADPAQGRWRRAPCVPLLQCPSSEQYEDRSSRARYDEATSSRIQCSALPVRSTRHLIPAGIFPDWMGRDRARTQRRTQLLTRCRRQGTRLVQTMSAAVGIDPEVPRSSPVQRPVVRDELPRRPSGVLAPAAHYCTSGQAHQLDLGQAHDTPRPQPVDELRLADAAISESTSGRAPVGRDHADFGKQATCLGVIDPVDEDLVHCRSLARPAAGTVRRGFPEPSAASETVRGYCFTQDPQSCVVNSWPSASVTEGRPPVTMSLSMMSPLLPAREVSQ